MRISIDKHGLVIEPVDVVRANVPFLIGLDFMDKYRMYVDTVVKAQKRFEAAQTPIIHLAMHMPQIFNDELEQIASCRSVSRSNGRGLVPSSTFSRKMARVMCGCLDTKVRVHDILATWMLSSSIYQGVPAHS